MPTPWLCSCFLPVGRQVRVDGPLCQSCPRSWPVGLFPLLGREPSPILLFQPQRRSCPEHFVSPGHVAPLPSSVFLCVVCFPRWRQVYALQSGRRSSAYPVDALNVTTLSSNPGNVQMKKLLYQKMSLPVGLPFCCQVFLPQKGFFPARLFHDRKEILWGF